MRIRIGIAFILLLACASPVWAQTAIENEQKYLLLATSKTSTMQRELDAAAALGFKVMVGSGIEGAEIALLLERVPADAPKMTYKLLATSHTGTMERELNDAAKDGYRLLPRTLSSKKAAFLGPEIVAVMERDPAVPKVMYKLLATSRTGTLQKELSQAITEGYKVAGMVSRGEHILILEREAK